MNWENQYNDFGVLSLIEIKLSRIGNLNYERKKCISKKVT